MISLTSSKFYVHLPRLIDGRMGILFHAETEVDDQIGTSRLFAREKGVKM
jgi:hypothetical protein